VEVRFDLEQCLVRHLGEAVRRENIIVQVRVAPFAGDIDCPLLLIVGGPEAT
jgi:hypothetical protein